MSDTTDPAVDETPETSGAPIQNVPTEDAPEDIKAEGATAPAGNGRKLPRWVGIATVLIGSISSAGAAWYGLIKGDPDAQHQAAQAEVKSDKVYDTLRRQQNQMAKVLNSLQLWQVAQQAKQEARTSMQLQAELEALHKKLDAVKVKPAAPAAVEDVAAPPKCLTGRVRVGAKCLRVPKAVAADMIASRKAVIASARKLRAERKHRKRLERRAMPTTQPITKIQQLPDSLDMASKKNSKK